MRAADFDTIFERRIHDLRLRLAHKAKEYASSDRLHNFKLAGDLKGESASKALVGMLVKHWVSIMDMVEGRQKPTKAMVDEKIGDAVSYLCLLEACLIEQINASEAITQRQHPQGNNPT